MSTERQALLDKWVASSLSLDEANKLINILIGDAYLLEAIESEIHYPECWDTAAYPMILDAIHNIGCNREDCTKK